MAVASDRIDVQVRETRNESSVKRALKISGHDDMWFEVEGGPLPPPLAVHDFAAMSVLFIAMREGKDIFIEGPVTIQCLRNLYEFQDLWANWVPEGYARINITAENVVDKPVCLNRQGLFAFSGGVDGTAALLRHIGDELGVRRIAPAGVMLAHGYDILLADNEWFAVAEKCARDAVREFDLPFYVLRTNYRNFQQNWPLEHGAGLFAGLHQFAGLADWGVVGANETYADLCIPWGSSPMFNHMFSGGAFGIHTECGGMTRCERVAKICEYPEVAKQIRVCWEKNESGKNCGKCEKCVRTKLNFAAINREPVCFDEPLTVGEILKVRANSRIKIIYHREILVMGEKNKMAIKYRIAVFLMILKSEILVTLRSVKNLIKKLITRRRRGSRTPFTNLGKVNHSGGGNN